MRKEPLDTMPAAETAHTQSDAHKQVPYSRATAKSFCPEGFAERNTVL